MRKYKTKGKQYTAGDLKSDDYLSKLIHLDKGYRVLRNLKGSPPYFKKCHKYFFAMIREIGNPTWWPHHLKILGKLFKQEKSERIQKDPVTCARNFQHMVQLFIRDVLKSNAMPIGEMVYYFYRVEFQQRE